MILNYLCPPALLYAVIMLIYLILELSNKKYHQAFIKSIVGIIFTCILQAFCQMNIGLISWVFVMIPIIFYTYITLLTFFIFGVNPDKDKLDKPSPIIPKSIVSPASVPASRPASVPGAASVPVPSLPVPAPSLPVSTPAPVPASPDPAPKISDYSKNNPCYHQTNDSSCNDLSICSWSNSTCNMNDVYNYELNKLYTNCNKYDNNTCANDKLCNFIKDECVPTNDSKMNLFNADDCKKILTRPIMELSSFGKLANMPGNEISPEEQKITQQKLDDALKQKVIDLNKIIDTSGCEVASKQCSIM